MINFDRMVERFEEYIAKHRRVVLAAIVILSILAAWSNRFVQDDAFISFNYAKSFVNGEGLTWSGTRIEGYTNFLWVLWIALGIKLNIDPILWSYVGSLGSFAATVCGTWLLAYLIFDAFLPSILSVLLLISNYSVLAYATGGLETMLQTALLCLSAYIFFKISKNKAADKKTVVLLSFLLSLAILTRIDSALPGMIIGLGTLIIFYQQRYSWKFYFALAFPLLLIVGVWMVWKIFYYGEVLPNTYYAKKDWYVALSGNGIKYIGRFLHWYRLWPFLALGGLILPLRQKWIDRQVPLLLLLVLSWYAYVVGTGGDFMEFRFLISIAPFFFILLAYLIFYPLGQGLVRNPIVCSIVSLIIIIVSSYNHASNFQGITEDRTLDSIPLLATFYGLYPDRQWGEIGTRLGEELAETDPIVALSAVGTIPFYSGLKTVDTLGLNDSYVARHCQLHGDRLPRPGHQRVATLSYLEEREVNLIIGHPKIVSAGPLSNDLYTVRRWVLLRGFDIEELEETIIVAMPLDSHRSLLMWYLTRSEQLDRIIEQRGWETITLSWSQ
jgi:hypothetical protein